MITNAESCNKCIILESKIGTQLSLLDTMRQELNLVKQEYKKLENKFRAINDNDRYSRNRND